MTKFLKVLLISLFILQLLVSSSFELAHDEAYYWLFSKNLDWGYFDHPPLVAVVIRLFSFLPHSEWSVRIGFVLLQFSTLFLLFKLIDARYHLRTTLLFFSFPLASFAGLLALPDMPLLFMTGLYCLFLKQYLEKRDNLRAIILAIVIALLLYAKYHGILLVFFTLVALPGLFKDKRFYIIALMASLLFLPHVWWQFQHEFATLRYHFLDRPNSAFNLKRTFEFLAVQIGLAGVLVGPLVWWTVVKRPAKSEFERAMKVICLGTVAFFFVSTFSKKFEANWTIFLSVPLIYLTACSAIWEKKILQSLLYGSFSLVVLARLIFLFPAETFGIKRLKEFNGWKKWSQEVNQKCEGRLVANSYQIASKLSFYLDREVHSLNYQSRRNQFDVWRLDLKSPIKNVCYLTDVREFDGERVVTPDGKDLLLVKSTTYDELLSRKESSMR